MNTTQFFIFAIIIAIVASLFLVSLNSNSASDKSDKFDISSSTIFNTQGNPNDQSLDVKKISSSEGDVFTILLLGNILVFNVVFSSSNEILNKKLIIKYTFTRFGFTNTFNAPIYLIDDGSTPPTQITGEVKVNELNADEVTVTNTFSPPTTNKSNLQFFQQFVPCATSLSAKISNLQIYTQ